MGTDTHGDDGLQVEAVEGAMEPFQTDRRLLRVILRNLLDNALKYTEAGVITLSADHRVTDGAEVARFLQVVKRYLEHPLTIAFG